MALAGDNPDYFAPVDDRTLSPAGPPSTARTFTEQAERSRATFDHRARVVLARPGAVARDWIPALDRLLLHRRQQASVCQGRGVRRARAVITG